MEDVLLCGSSVDQHEPLNWSRRGVKDVWRTVSCIVVSSEDLDSLPEDGAPLPAFFFFSIGHHRGLEV